MVLVVRKIPVIPRYEPHLWLWSITQTPYFYEWNNNLSNHSLPWFSESQPQHIFLILASDDIWLIGLLKSQKRDRSQERRSLVWLQICCYTFVDITRKTSDLLHNSHSKQHCVLIFHTFLLPGAERDFNENIMRNSHHINQHKPWTWSRPCSFSVESEVTDPWTNLGATAQNHCIPNIPPLLAGCSQSHCLPCWPRVFADTVLQGSLQVFHTSWATSNRLLQIMERKLCGSILSSISVCF